MFFAAKVLKCSFGIGLFEIIDDLLGFGVLIEYNKGGNFLERLQIDQINLLSL